MQSLVLLFEDFYIRTDNTVLQPYNWPRQMTRGWVLLLLNIRLHVKGFNKLIYILEPTPRHVFLAFQTIRTRRFVLK